ncbi:hypothetical protein PMAC_002304 [Pneumocystis sp. 'macacae']|nr:hypothetical protein PMAC_002304 [Pneumocystis sp. 'macacae']
MRSVPDGPKAYRTMSYFDWTRFPEETLEESGDNRFEFEDTYDGLGEELEETKDDMNEDTFGIDAGGIGNDFDFSTQTQKMVNLMNNEQVLYRNKGKMTVKEKDVHFLSQVLGKEDNFSQKSFGLDENQHIPHFQQIHQTESANNINSCLVTAAETVFENPIIELPKTFVSETTIYSCESVKKHLKGYMSLEEVEAKFFDINKKKDFQKSTQNDAFDMKKIDAALYTEMKKKNKSPETKGIERTLSRYNFYTDVSSQYINHSEEKKNEKTNEIKILRKNHEDDMYNGLMTTSDKNFINRIQLSQLVSDDPYSDDFYYYVYNSSRNEKSQQKQVDKSNTLYSSKNEQTSNFKNKHDENPILKMLQQIQNIVATGKSKPKATQLSLEGALGKISFSTVRTPRQILNIKKPIDNNTDQGSSIKTHNTNVKKNHKFYLYCIEKIYDDLLEIEEIFRKQKHDEENDLSIDNDKQNKTLKILKERIWKNLQIMEPITKKCLHLLSVYFILTVFSPNVTHPFITIISYNKGKKLIPRIFEHINTEQKLTILTVIAIHLDHLDVILYDLYNLSSESRSPSMKENIDIFIQVALPSLLACVSEASLQIIIDILSIMLDRMNFQLIIMTKIGLSFLTMLISRAEIIKQFGQASENDLKQWRNVYDLMFSKLVGRFVCIFPPSLSFSDEIYPWQFMAACAISSTIEQQHILVTEVREKVLDNVISSKSLPPDVTAIKLGNVNLFLHALGLDIEQLNI